MNYLLDTQTLLWIVTDDTRLSKTVSRLFLDQQNEIFLSAASIWEMAIKISLQKLLLKGSLKDFATEHVLGNNIKILPIRLEHLYKLSNLPFHHRDPFDRLLIVQSLSENYPIISSNHAFEQYPVKRIW